MPKPKSPTSKRRTSTTLLVQHPGFLTGNNARRVGYAHAVLADALRAWMESFGGLDGFAKLIGQGKSVPRKIVTSQIVLPEKAGLEWSAKLKLSGSEQRDVAFAVALSSAHVDVLRFFDADWQSCVEQLGNRLKKYAARRQAKTK